MRGGGGGGGRAEASSSSACHGSYERQTIGNADVKSIMAQEITATKMDN